MGISGRCGEGEAIPEPGRRARSGPPARGRPRAWITQAAGAAHGPGRSGLPSTGRFLRDPATRREVPGVDAVAAMNLEPIGTGSLPGDADSRAFLRFVAAGD